MNDDKIRKLTLQIEGSVIEFDDVKVRIHEILKDSVVIMIQYPKDKKVKFKKMSFDS